MRSAGRPKRATRSFALAVLVSAWTACTCVAYAHGRYPNPTIIDFHPTDPNVILLQTARGLIGTHDGGATWQWMCYEVVGADTFGLTDPVMTIMGDGSVLVPAQSSGVLTLDSSWCSTATAPPDPATSYFIVDVQRDPTAPDVAFALTSSAGTTINRLFRSANDGQTWTETNPGIDSTLLENVRIAPSNPQVIYVSAIATDAMSGQTDALLYKSTDGGASWGTGPIDTFALAAGEHRAVIAGIDPVDPDVLFLVVEHDEAATPPPAEHVLQSTNGGTSFTDVLSTSHVSAFAISDDGTKVWVGNGEDSGLWRSTDGGATFTSLDAGLQVPCLAWHGGKLWVCGNNAVTGYALATSTDDGDTLTPFFSFSQVTAQVSCPAGTAGADACSANKCDALTELQVDLPTVAPECVMTAGVHGGGCAVARLRGGGSGGGGWGPLAGLLALGLGVVLWRRRGSIHR